MKRTFLLTTVALLSLAPAIQAQVYVRAPFVRVGVGNGVFVQAPYVNLYVPPTGPVVYPYGPPIILAPPPGNGPFLPPQPQPIQPIQPVPPAKDDNAPPLPVQPIQAPTLEGFAKSFQAKAGSYDVTMINPVTGQPTVVRFTLPEGSPKRVIVRRYEIEFFYGLRHFVRIEFDRDGATVISR
jgi:hypothetical protein